MKKTVFLIILLFAGTVWAEPEFSDCRVTGSNGISQLQGECAFVTVPEDRDIEGSREIALHIMRLKARARDVQSDPVFFIAGGPGQSATDGYLAEGGAFYFVRKQRDIILLDQRGTGQSNRMQCPEPETGLDIDAINAETRRAWITQCLSALPGDPRLYTTLHAIEDLEHLRRELEYNQINLYGISYGTRVALAYLRAYPENVRSVIIDGVVPMDLALGPNISLEAQRALDNIFERCTTNTACHDAFPDIRQSFYQLLERLREQHVNVSLRDPTTGEPIDIEFDDELLGGALRLLSYQKESVSLMPLLIHQASVNNDFVPLAAQAIMVTKSIGEMIAYGMHNAVVCNEDVPFYGASAAQQAAMRNTYLGTMQFDVLVEICAQWPVYAVPETFKQALVSDKPVLLFSGELDPITPPANGERAARTLPNSLHVVAPGQGHGVAPRGCAPTIMATFIEQASVNDLDVSCIDTLQSAPFFVRFSGPDP
ncbi:MAG: alpha/beta hydrolase [Gammaproteobacteria bacterium]